MGYAFLECSRKRRGNRKNFDDSIENALANPIRIEAEAEADSLIHALWPFPGKSIVSIIVPRTDQR